MAYRYCEFLRRMHMLERSPIFKRKRKIYKKRLDPLIELSESDFRSRYRFSKESMEKLIAIVREGLEGDRRGGHIPAHLKVMAAIRYWVRNEIQDDAADIHGFSQPTLSNICCRVAKSFASKAKQFIEMPQTASEQKEIIEKFEAIRGFPQVIGAIDCTHIRIQTQGGEDGTYYINQNGYYSINVQAVCDPNLKIRDIVCHWRGSTHDSHIYSESTIKDNLEKGEFCGRLLGDGEYECTNHLFTPVQNPVNSSEENYNIAHSATLNTIERTFRAWKSRFRILRTGMRGSLDNVRTTILALAVLHNLGVEYNDILDDEYDDFNENDTENEIPISIPIENQIFPYEGEAFRTAFIDTYFNIDYPPTLNKINDITQS